MVDEDQPQQMNKPLLCLAVGAGAGMALGGVLGGLFYFIIGLCAGAGAGFAVVMTPSSQSESPLPFLARIR